MSDSQGQGFPENPPDPPNIPPDIQFKEEATLAGMLIGSVLYGILIVLFFQCMAALLNPIHRRGWRIKWGLVFYTAVMFSVATVFTAMNLGVQFLSFFNYHGFAGGGPLGYHMFIGPTVLRITPSLTFLLNNWLANGLLLYRCYVIYSINLGVVALPCLIYLGSLAIGAILIYQSSQPGGSTVAVAVNFVLLYLSISVSLDVLLTLMIAVRLIMHTRNIRTATGAPARIGGLYKAITTTLVESSALYAVSSLLALVPWIARSGVAEIFLPALAETQVIASLLIIRRVAKKRALTGNTIVYGNSSSSKVGSRGELISSGDALPGGRSGVRIDTTVDFHWDKI